MAGKDLMASGSFQGVLIAVASGLSAYFYAHGVALDAETIIAVLGAIAGVWRGAVGRMNAETPITSVGGVPRDGAPNVLRTSAITVVLAVLVAMVITGCGGLDRRLAAIEFEAERAASVGQISAVDRDKIFEITNQLRDATVSADLSQKQIERAVEQLKTALSTLQK